MLVLAGGGFGGYAVWNAHELSVAKAACAKAADSARVASNECNTLLNGDAAGMAEVKPADAKDAKTVTALTDALKAETPKYEGRVADDKTGLDAATVKLGEQVAWYAKHVESLQSAVDALLKSSDGKVADNATRTALEKAVKDREAAAIATAFRKVNESVVAKSKADEESAKAQAEVAAATGGSSSGTGAGGSAYAGTGWSYTGGGYTTPSTPTPTTNGTGGGTTDPFDPDGDEWGGGCEVSESNPSCDTGWTEW